MPHRPSTPALAGTTALDHLVFAPTQRDDRRLKLALIATTALHLAVLAVALPKESARPTALPKTATAVPLTSVRIRSKPPEPITPKPPLRKPATKSVPLPEPPPIEPVVDLAPPEPVPLPIPEAPVYVPPPPAPAPPASTPPSEPLRVGAGIELPARTVFVEPRYSASARKVGIEGTVILDTVIDRQGQIRRVEVLRGLPMGLTEEAIRAVSQWRFEPPTALGKPVELAYVVTVRFQLR